MIKYFAIENYRSIKKECVIDFDLNIPKNNPFPANTVIGFAGANASGKTTVLQALNFVLWFMKSSFLTLEGNKNIPCKSFIGSEDELTKFHLIISKEIIIDEEKKKEKFVDYEYILHLTKEKVIYEEVNYYPNGRKKNIYIRNLSEVKFGRGIKTFDTVDLRENSSIISFAKQFKSQLIASKISTYLFQSNITNEGLLLHEFNASSIEELLNSNNELSLQLINFLKLADIGIDSISVKKRDEQEEKTLTFNASRRSLQDIIEIRLDNHEVKVDIKTLIFKHKMADSYADFFPEQESSGTLQFLLILGSVLIAIKYGMTLILDEIEIKLHQNLVAYLIGLFQNPSFNTNGAQLIFSFHNSYLMNILEPHQLWFTEKNDDGETEVFSANDFKDISKFGKEHLEELYRIGRFGAVPRGI